MSAIASTKKFIKHFVITVLCLLLCSHSLMAQTSKEELARLLEGKTRLDDIMTVVHQYYKTHKEVAGLDKETDYQHWVRWEKWMRPHLDEKGEFTNIAEKTNAAITQLDQRYGPAAAPSAAYRVEGASPNGTSSASGFWTPLGPFTNNVVAGGLEGVGRMDRIAFHPTDANTIFSGSPGGGLWKTTDGGANWACITNSIPLLAISGIAVNYNNPNIIYILTGDGDSHRGGYFVFNAGYSANSDGVYKTTDGGVTWYKTGTLNAGTGWFGRKLAMDPLNPNTLIAATSVGLYKTTDGGGIWTQVRSGEHFDVEYKPGSSTVVYASVSGGVRYSTTSGNSGTWLNSALDINPARIGRVDLAVSPNNPNYVYALFGPGWCNQAPDGSCNGTGYFFGGIYRSVNSGANFSRRSNTPNILGNATNGQDGADQSDYDMGITVNPFNAEYIVTCGTTVWNSVGNTGGTSMTYSTSYGNGTYYIHPDCHDVAYNSLNAYLYAATDGGFFRSVDNGVNWTNLTAGLATTQIYHMKGWDSNSDGLAEGPHLLIGCQDNGLKYRSAFGTTFNHIVCCDGFYSSFSPASSNTIWYSTNASTCFTTNGGVSTNCVLGVDFFPTVAIDPGNANNIYVGYYDTLYKSTNAGGSFTKLGGVRVEDELVVCPSNTARLYGIAGGYSSARRNDNFGTGAWTTISGTSGWPGGLPVTDIKPRPTTSLEVYACFGGYSAGNKVVRSTNGGGSWAPYSGSLPNVPFHSLAVASDGALYAGSDIGVFYRAAGAADWVPFYNGLPRVPVTDLVLTDFGNIYCSTFGRGVWFSDVYSNCNPVITVNGAINGQNYYEASQYASVTSTTNGGNGTQLFVKAGDSVVMRPGFEVKSGSYFKAYLGPCGSGGIPVANRVNSQADSLASVKAMAAFQQLPTQIKGINKDGYLEIVLKDFGTLKAEISFQNGAVTQLENKLYPPGVYWLPFKTGTAGAATLKVSLNGVPLKAKE
jgi:photosystem II stability/assembly factor-like uncharacterized protein